MIRKITALSLFTTAFFYSSLSQSDTASHQEYLKFKSHDHDEISFDNGKRLAYTVISRSIKNNTEIVTARIEDALQADLAHYNNLIVTLDNSKQELKGFAETSDGHFQLDTKNGIVVWKKINKPKALDSILNSTSSGTNNITAARALDVDSEKDADGNYVIDVYMGFSDQAAARAGNIEAYAQMQVETVNTALKNSNIQGVYLRLVGVGTTPNNPGIIWRPIPVLDVMKDWFKDDIARLQPDLIGLQQVQSGAPESAGGWASIGGDTQVVDIDLPGAWRHEVGHNVGGNHCKEATDTGYKFGYSVREGRGTAMCGNDLAYYSSPLIRDEEGNVLGTAEGQDMARAWRERMAEIASNRIHTVPYTSSTSLPITIQAEDYVDAYDTTTGNQGGAYRSDNVDIQTTTDTDGGFNVGWTAAGEWLTYNIVVPADGNYEFSYRVASPNGGGIIQLEKAGGSPIYGSVQVPATGDWQKWTTIKHTVALKAGAQKIGLVFKTSGFNINWFHIEKVAVADGNYTIQNRWISDQSINIERGVLESSSVSSSLLSDQWILERISGTNYYRIKNRLKPTLFINIENGKLDATTAADGWWSTQWILEPVDGTTDQFRIKNRWKADQYINVENSVLTASAVQPGWWSAMWKLTSVK